MNKALIPSLTFGVLLALTGCTTSSRPNTAADRAAHGPDGTIAYLVEVTSSEPGARIEVNGEYVGKTPLTIKIFGDKDGTFHNFGSIHYVNDYVITAYPVKAHQARQTRRFHTGGLFMPEDKIPKKIFFDFTPRERWSS